MNTAAEGRQLTLPMWRSAADDVERVSSDIDAWAQSSALAEIVCAFGGTSADYHDLVALEAFSSRHWDFRAGRERDQVVERGITNVQRDLVLKGAAVLGLAGRENPHRTHYDAVLLTGGMVRAGIVKPRFVVELNCRGVSFDRVVFLGARRNFSGEEQTLARALGVDGTDEVEGMLEGVRRSFAVSNAPYIEHSTAPAGSASWGRWRWAHPKPIVEVIAAPSSQPEIRRANTADTFRFWAEQFVDGARSVLVVTTPVYVPYQAAVAVETLGVEAGISVETVGVSVSANDLGEFTQLFTAHHHLQELRSAIRGLASLEQTLRSSSAAH